MPTAPNSARGEAEFRVDETRIRLRPSFAALVAAEDEIGPLLALVDRAGAGKILLAEIAALFWHCADPRPQTLTREAVGDALVFAGLAQVTPQLRVLLSQILQG
jgi:Phage tail tube protein, GTA-gp10